MKMRHYRLVTGSKLFDAELYFGQIIEVVRTNRQLTMLLFDVDDYMIYTRRTKYGI